MHHFFITRTPWCDEKPWQDSRDEKQKVRGDRLWSPGTIWHLKRTFECFNSQNYSSDGNDIKRLTRHVDGLLYSPGLRGHASSSWLSAYLPCYLRVWQELGMERRQIKKWWGNLRESASQFLAIEVSGVAGWPTTGQIRRPSIVMSSHYLPGAYLNGCRGNQPHPSILRVRQQKLCHPRAETQQASQTVNFRIRVLG